MSGKKQTCRICGVTVDDCGTWHACPYLGELICWRCHTRCKYLKVYNGYIEKCMCPEDKKIPLTVEKHRSGKGENL